VHIPKGLTLLHSELFMASLVISNVKRDCSLTRTFHRVKARSGGKAALAAVRRQIIRTAWGVLMTGEPYRDTLALKGRALPASRASLDDTAAHTAQRAPGRGRRKSPRDAVSCDGSRLSDQGAEAGDVFDIFMAIGALRRFQHHREMGEARVIDDAAEALQADMPLADGGVAGPHVTTPAVGEGFHCTHAEVRQVTTPFQPSDVLGVHRVTGQCPNRLGNLSLGSGRALYNSVLHSADKGDPAAGRP